LFARFTLLHLEQRMTIKKIGAGQPTESLHVNKDVLRLFIDRAPAALAMFDQKMRYLAVSRRWKEEHSIGERDIIGAAHYEVFPDIPDEWKRVHQLGLAGEIIKNDEDQFVRADGTSQWKRWEVSPWFSKNESIGGIIIFSEDITQYKQAEESIRKLNAELDAKLQELQTLQIELKMQNEALQNNQIALLTSRDRYFNLYEFASVSYFSVSKTGEIFEINHTGSLLLGEDRDRLLRQAFDRYVLPTHKSKWMRFLDEAFKHPNAQSSELQMRKKDDSLIHVTVLSRQIKLEDGVDALLITLTDITEHKQREIAKHEFERILNLLTPRERDVLALALTGMHNSEISEKLNIHQRTVENHRARIHLKTGVDSLLTLIQMALHSGLHPKDLIQTTRL
jgi:PAS domain S-box-containing protein